MRLSKTRRGVIGLVKASCAANFHIYMLFLALVFTWNVCSVVLHLTGME